MPTGIICQHFHDLIAKLNLFSIDGRRDCPLGKSFCLREVEYGRVASAGLGPRYAKRGIARR